MRRFVPPPIKALDPSPVATGLETLAGGDPPEMGYAEGIVEGEARARAAAEHEMARLRAALDEKNCHDGVAGSLAQLLAARDADREAMERLMRGALTAALNALFPSLITHAAAGEIRALIEQAVSERAEDKITIRASAETIATVKSRGLPEGVDGRVTFVPAAKHPYGAADIAWTGGGMTFDPADLLRKVNDALSPIFF